MVTIYASNCLTVKWFLFFKVTFYTRRLILIVFYYIRIEFHAHAKRYNRFANLRTYAWVQCGQVLGARGISDDGAAGQFFGHSTGMEIEPSESRKERACQVFAPDEHGS